MKMGRIWMRSSLGNMRRRRLGNMRWLGNARRWGNLSRLGDVKRRVGDMCIRRLEVVRRLGDKWKRLLSTMYHTGLSRLNSTTFVTYLLIRFQQFS